jgi:MFS family permease
LTRIVRTYYAIAGLFTLSAALIWGVNTLFLLDAGLDILEVFLANAAFTAGMVIFEIPTGLVADSVGRRLSFLFSAGTLALSTVAYLLVARAGGGVLPFAAVSVLMGLGFTFYSGAAEAWLVDALHHEGYRGQLDAIFARGAIVTGSAMVVGTVAGGVLGDVDLALPYLARAVSLAAAFSVGWLAMHDLGFTPKAARAAELPARMEETLRHAFRIGWGERSVRMILCVSFLQWGFMSWGFYAWQPYFLELLGRDAVWIAGAAASAIAAAMILGNVLVEWLSRFCGRRSTLLLWAAGAQAVAAVGVGATDSFVAAVAFIVLLAVGIGVTGPVKQAYLHSKAPSAQRASVVSLDSMSGNAGGIVGQVGLGWLARTRSIETGYVTGGFALLFALPPLLALRRLGETSDLIIGRSAGAPAPCAAQGIPEVAGVDARSRVAV